MTDPQRTICHWRGSFYTWRGSHWREFDVADITAHLYSVLANASYLGSAATPTELPWRPTPQKINAVVGALAAHVLRPTELEPDDSTGSGIAFANGVLDMVTRTMRPHTPAWFNFTALPYDYNPDAPKPTEWLAFLSSLWGEDAPEADLLQEWMGYLVSGRTDMQKLMFLIGVPGAGKGVITSVCEALVGKDNHAPLYVESLLGEFGLERAIGKTLLTMGDARFTSKNARDALQKLLSIVGGDPVPVNRKNKLVWDGRLPGRFMISTNEPPNIPDSASAMRRRTLLLYFHESFEGREDRGLTQRLIEEMPGILNWALEGYDRLVSAGRYVDNWTEPEGSAGIKREIEELGAPVKAFMRECCRPVADASIPKSELYEAWSRWCDDNGRHPSSSPVFFRDLFAAYPKLRAVKVRGGPGSRVPSIGGVELTVRPSAHGDLR